MATATRPSYNSSAQKTLLLVEALATVPGPLGVSELGRIVGASRGTVHKQLHALVECGWVEQGDDGRYGLSLTAARVGNAALNQAGLGRRIHTLLERIVEQTGETISIAALHRGTALIVQRAESDQLLHANVRVGTQIPLAETASSQILCAFAMTREQRDALRGKEFGLPSEEQLDQVRAAGVAHTVDEFITGVTAVSVPLHDSLHYKTVALTLAGPNRRIDFAAAEQALRAGRDQINSLVSGDTEMESNGGLHV